MGCDLSKAIPGGGTTRRIQMSYHPMNDNGMGCISKAYDELYGGIIPSSFTQGPYSLDQSWEIDPKRLHDDSKVFIGEGLFGDVFQANLALPVSSSSSSTTTTSSNGSQVSREGEDEEQTAVIVKRLTNTESKELLSTFLQEIQIQKLVSEDEGFLRFLGAVTTERPYLMIFECPSRGNLKNFLIHARGSGLADKHTLAGFCEDVCSAMEYLHSRNIILKDLATRNCSITASMEVKLSDVGISRSIFPHEYYTHPKYGLSLPIRWMAMELLQGPSISFSKESDVWAYGVFLFETYSFANLPFPSLSNAEVSAAILSGMKPEPPKTAPKEIGHIMKACFEMKERRPTFSSLLNSISEFAALFVEPGEFRRGNETQKHENVLLSDEAVDKNIFQEASTPGNISREISEMFAPITSELGNSKTNGNKKESESQDGGDVFYEIASNEPPSKLFIEKLPLPHSEQRETDQYANPQDTVSSSVATDDYSANPSKGAYIRLADATKFVETHPSLIGELKSRKSFRNMFSYDEETDTILIQKLEKTKVPEFASSQIILSNQLGEGAFGVVYRGTLSCNDAKPIHCAVKTLKNDANEGERDALFAEAFLVFQFKHKNVVTCLGQCSEAGKAMILFEYMEKGSLFTVLKDTEVSLERKMKMALDISNGMRYLSLHHHVHRDLAARNILVSADMTSKISDFGLSRNLEEDTYYESEGGLIPVRWTPPEAYKYKKFSSASDVWSFGILLYEIWTRGALPYGKNWTNFQVMSEVERGFRLPPPPSCPKAIYAVMIDCWNPIRVQRPNFVAINDRLQFAHDMLFSALDVASLKIDTDYGNLNEQYLGVPVPTFEELEKEPPTPHTIDASKMATRLSAEEKGFVQYELASKEADESKEAIKDALSPSAPSVLKRLLRKHNTEENEPEDDEGITSNKDGDANGERIEYESAANHRFSMGNKRIGSLRKQRAASQYFDMSDKQIEESGHKSVAEMKKFSEELEQMSKLEQRGIKNVERALGVSNLVEKRDFIESVGRAVDVSESSNIKGRKKCICRRAKCVCKFED